MIFFDATGRRWRLCRWFLFTTICFSLLAGALFTAGTLLTPQFPPVKFDQARVNQQSELRDQTGAPGDLVKVPFTETGEAAPVGPVLQPAASSPADAKPPVIMGLHVPWHAGSLPALKANVSHMTHVLCEWAILENGDGDIQDLTEPEVVQWARQAHLPVLVMATNFQDGEWRASYVHKILARRSARRRLVANLIGLVRKYDLAGLNLDFEQVPVKDRDLLTAFVRELHDALSPAGLLLTQDVPTDDPNEAAYDLDRLARWNDYVMPMVYDEHFSAGAPGPIASLPWVHRQLEGVLKRLPKDKTVIGLGAYGYDWTIGSRSAAVEVGFTDIMSRANQYRGNISWHGTLMNPALRYSKAGEQHEAWFLDAVTALNSVREARRMGFGGVMFWHLGTEDPALWSMFKDRTWPSDNLRPDALARLAPIDAVRQYGRSEAISVSQTRSPGKRDVWMEGAGYGERFVRPPAGDVVVGVGFSDEKLVTLTFDDGPDPRYTPRILDILKAKHAPAAFFVVGKSAERSNDLLRRMYAEGHTVGSHTYSHIHELRTPKWRLNMELNLTQRLVQDVVGRSTALFRSPYNADSDPRTPAEIQSVLWPQQMGYLTVGERIDPRDWESRTAGEILKNLARERELGNIVLLHDGGGDREATVQALPALIDSLRARGDRLVSLPELLGQSREDLMPAVAGPERFWAAVVAGILRSRAMLAVAVQVLFLTAIALTLLRSLVYGVLAIVQRVRSARRRFDPGFRPPVSVIVAARNEAKVIANTVRSLLDSTYPFFEVIVVDDGSTDETSEILRSEQYRHRCLRVFTQPHSGKAVALNRAIAESRHEFLVALDADTQFLPDTIAKLVRHFEDPNVAAVSGNAKVGNVRGWLTRLQSVEYVCGFNLDRRALELINAVVVVPGAVGAWRKSAIIEAGGFTSDTVAEDTDLTLAIRRRGYLIRYDDKALAFTEAPETLGALVRQRRRWAFGTLQSVWKHRDTTFRPRYGTMGFVTMPSIWLYHVMLACVSPFAEIALLSSVLSGELRTVAIYYAALLGAELATGLLAYALESDEPRNLASLPFQRLLYPRLMLYVICVALFHALGGRAMAWSGQVRTATVLVPCPEIEPARSEVA
jgi:peptidoglycan/xylan/chitin deacetylase (PgdA/CDA1 family)